MDSALQNHYLQFDKSPVEVVFVDKLHANRQEQLFVGAEVFQVVGLQNIITIIPSTTETNLNRLPISIQTDAGKGTKLGSQMLWGKTSRNNKKELEQFTEVLLRGNSEYKTEGQVIDCSETFMQFLESEGLDAVRVFEHALQDGLISNGAAGWFLRYMGQTDHPGSKEYRRILLEKFLAAQSVDLRFGALLGLVSLGDKSSITAIEDAFQRETALSVKRAMGNGLKNLSGKFA